MKKYGKLMLVIGMVLLAVVITLLLNPRLTEKDTSLVAIDTEQWMDSAHILFVKTSGEFPGNEYFTDFPEDIGAWHGVDEDFAGIRDFLGAEMLLLRSYRLSSFSQPLYLLIGISFNETSLHPPEICYLASGYKILASRLSNLEITGNSSFEIYSKSALSNGASPLQDKIWVQEFVIAKKGQGGEIQERTLVQYLYIKKIPNSYGGLGIVRVSTLIPPQGPYEKEKAILQEFFKQVIPLIFHEKQTVPTLLNVLIGRGIGGYAALTGMIGFPLISITLAIIMIRRPTAHAEGIHRPLER